MNEQIRLDVKAAAFAKDGSGARMLLRFREHVAKMTLGDVECEISLCLSRAFIYFQTKDRQVRVGLQDLGEAVFRHWGFGPKDEQPAQAGEE